MSNKRGFTLIELLIAITIISVGVVGLMVAFSTGVRGSADPLISKQTVAIAEEIMEEVLLKPYADPSASPANASTTCGTGGAADRSAFNEVLDYHNYQTTGICAIDGTPLSDLTAYGLRVTVTNVANWNGAPNTLQVTVTVSRGTIAYTLTNWRTNPI